MAGTLKLTVASVDGTLPRTDAVGNPDPYCKLSLLSSPPAVVASVQAEATTPVCENDRTSPAWDAAIALPIQISEPATLKIEVVDRDAGDGSADDLLAWGLVDLRTLVPGWDNAGAITPSTSIEYLGDAAVGPGAEMGCRAALLTVDSAGVRPGEEVTIILSHMEFVPDAELQRTLSKSEIPSVERKPLPPHFSELGPRPRTGTLFVLMQPFERMHELMDNAAVYLEGDDDGVLNEVEFATRMTTMAEDQCGPFDQPATEAQLDQVSDMNGLAMSWVEESGEMALPASISEDLALGRSIVVEGNPCMLQTAKLKYKRVKVLNGVDEAVETQKKEAAKEEALERCASAEERAELMLTHSNEAEAAAEAPPVPLDDEYEMVDFADADPDVAAFLTAVRANLYRPAKPPAPEPEPEPSAADVGEDDLRAACEAAGIEVTDEMTPEEMRAALEALYTQQAADRALEAAMAAKLAAEEELGALDRNKVAQLKTYKVPPTAVHAVLQAVLLLLGYSTKKAADWAGARKLVGDNSFWSSLAEFDVEEATREKKLKKKRLANVESLLEAAGGESGAERASIVALVLYKWCAGCLEVVGAVKRKAEMEKAAAAEGEEGEAAPEEGGEAPADEEEESEEEEESDASFESTTNN